MESARKFIAHVDDSIQKNSDDIVRLRRHIHANPELSRREFETTELLSNKLRDAGFEVNVRDQGYGFYADLTPENFDPETQPTVAVRADLDALAIQELNDVEYRSQKPGVMHACGHDVHMSCVTGVGLGFAEQRASLPGRIRLIFQHAEESVPGGAVDMVQFGAIDGVDAVLGMHVDPELEVGKIGVRPGPFTAAFDVFEFAVIGESGHGARPHHCIDPIFVLTQLSNSLYNAIGRTYDARDPVVLTIGELSGGTAPNIIPDEARLAGAVRTLSESHRNAVEPLLNRVAQGVCSTYGAQYDLKLTRGAPAIYNDEAITETIGDVARDLYGEESIYDIPLPSMGSEDFSYYLQEHPGAMFRLGVATAGRPRYFLHSARFDVDERALQIGMRVLAHSAVRVLEALSREGDGV